MQPELSHVEATAFRRAALQDGILDLLCGGCLIAWGVLVGAGQAVIGAVLFAAVWPMSVVLRRRLVRPRLGHVRLPERARRSRKLLLAGVFAFTLVLGLGVLLGGQAEPAPGWRARFESLGDLTIGLLLAFLATAIGLVWRVPRAHGYAVVILGAFVFARVALAPDGPWTLILPTMLSGAAVMATGGVLLARFLRRHPPQDPPSGLFDSAG